MTEQAMGPGTSTTARSVLKIDELVAGYGGGDVLRGVSLEVPEGGITCVVGPNGAGKSTLMATISGLLRPRLGSMMLDGQNLVGRSPRQVLERGVVQVPQNHSLFRDMTVHIRRLFDAFGPRRSYWGTDLTNSYNKASYKQRVTHFTEELSFLSEGDKDWVMGRAILARLKWA